MKATGSSSRCLFVADLAQAAVRSALSAFKESAAISGFDENSSRSANSSENPIVKAA